MLSKSLLRARVRALRDAEPPARRTAHDRMIFKRLKGFAPFKKAQSVFTYLSHGSEVSTDSLVREFFGKKKIFVPRVDGKRLFLCELTDPAVLQKGAFGIREPPNARALSQKIDVALIPAIAFDPAGHRIGFGGGYFDRLLAKLRATTIGLAYELQIIDKVPAASYDVPVDFIITERRILACSNSRAKTPRSTKSSAAK